MPSYKLIYFDIRGRAEIARLIFAYAGVKYEDVRLEFGGDQWSAMKPNTPFGQLPVLEVDGKQIGQTVAVAGYLAREFGLYGKTNLEGAIIDQVTCLIQEYINAAVNVMSETDEAKKAEMVKTINEETKPKYLGFFEKMLKQNGTGFFVGNAITLADLWVYDLVWLILQSVPTALDHSPLVKAHLERIGSTPAIKAYVAARKPTDM